MDSRNSSLVLRVCDFLGERVYPVGIISKGHYINHIVICVINIILVTTTISLNITTIIAYWKSSQLRKATSYFLVMLLSVIDLTNGVFGHTSYVFMLIKRFFGVIRECEMLTALQFMSCCFAFMSITTLFLLNIERYLNIVYPFQTRKRVTKTKILLVAIVFWCFAVVISIPCQMFARSISNYLIGISLFIIVLGSIYSYSRIYLESRKAANITPGTRNKARKRQDMKLAKSCAIVVGCTFLCLTPFAIVVSFPTDYVMDYIAMDWASTIAFASSTLNSVIFFWRNPVLRKEAKKIIMR